MWKWTKRFAGGFISSLSGWKVVDLLWGIPGRLDDSEVWQKWIEQLNASDTIYPIGVVGGILLGTSEWWWPRVSTWVKRIRTSQDMKGVEVTRAVLSTSNDAAHIERFKELKSVITRHRKALSPIRIPMSFPFLSVERQFEIRADREELVAHLDALKIPYPSSDAGRSEWFHYLVQLESSCQTGDLQEARSHYANLKEDC